MNDTTQDTLREYTVTLTHRRLSGPLIVDIMASSPSMAVKRVQHYAYREYCIPGMLTAHCDVTEAWPMSTSLRAPDRCAALRRDYEDACYHYDRAIERGDGDSVELGELASRVRETFAAWSAMHNIWPAGE
jgi:hypothetical protein